MGLPDRSSHHAPRQTSDISVGRQNTRDMIGVCAEIEAEINPGESKTSRAREVRLSVLSGQKCFWPEIHYLENYLNFTTQPPFKRKKTPQIGSELCQTLFVKC